MVLLNTTFWDCIMISTIRKHICVLLTIAIFNFSFSSCKKGSKPTPSISVTGKWTISRYIVTIFKNGVAGTPEISTKFDNAFYQFNSDGTGTDSNGDPSIVPLPFTYHVSNLSLSFSQTTYYLHATNCSITKTDDNHLILRGSYLYQSASDPYQVNEEVYLNK
jgi:hypothetical protein